MHAPPLVSLHPFHFVEYADMVTVRQAATLIFPIDIVRMYE
jgi:hypothetical protein